jgi:hypothetical protein
MTVYVVFSNHPDYIQPMFRMIFASEEDAAECVRKRSQHAGDQVSYWYEAEEVM